MRESRRFIAPDNILNHCIIVYILSWQSYRCRLIGYGYCALLVILLCLLYRLLYCDLLYLSLVCCNDSICTFRVKRLLYVHAYLLHCFSLQRWIVFFVSFLYLFLFFSFFLLILVCSSSDLLYEARIVIYFMFSFRHCHVHGSHSAQLDMLLGLWWIIRSVHLAPYLSSFM